MIVGWLQRTEWATALGDVPIAVPCMACIWPSDPSTAVQSIAGSIGFALMNVNAFAHQSCLPPPLLLLLLLLLLIVRDIVLPQKRLRLSISSCLLASLNNEACSKEQNLSQDPCRLEIKEEGFQSSPNSNTKEDSRGAGNGY